MSRDGQPLEATFMGVTRTPAGHTAGQHAAQTETWTCLSLHIFSSVLVYNVESGNRLILTASAIMAPKADTNAGTGSLIKRWGSLLPGG